MDCAEEQRSVQGSVNQKVSVIKIRRLNPDQHDHRNVKVTMTFDSITLKTMRHDFCVLTLKAHFC